MASVDVTVREAINQAIDEEMEADEAVFIYWLWQKMKTATPAQVQAQVRDEVLTLAALHLLAGAAPLFSTAAPKATDVNQRLHRHTHGHATWSCSG